MQSSPTVASLQSYHNQHLQPHHPHHIGTSSSSQSCSSVNGANSMQLAILNGIGDLTHHPGGHQHNGDEHSHQEIVSRRPSALLQDILATRRPSSIMAVMRGTERPHYLPPQRTRMLSSLHELSGSTKTIEDDDDDQLNHHLHHHHQHHHGDSMALTPTGQQRPGGGDSGGGGGGAGSSRGGGGGGQMKMLKNRNDRFCDQAQKYRIQNRRIGDDALSAALSALYAKVVVILGIAMPVTEVLTHRIPTNVYQGFYVYLYLTSIAFIVFLYITQLRTRAVVSLIKTYHESTGEYPIKRRAAHFGSFYLRVGAISFGIGTMVYSGLEFGQYFERSSTPDCSNNIFIALTPAARMALSIVQMQFIFLNTTELDMAKHKVIARFGLMHMVATNLCEWLYVLVEETKHEIHHFLHRRNKALLGDAVSTLNALGINTTTIIPDLEVHNNATLHASTNLTTTEVMQTQRSYFTENLSCSRTNIMGSLVQNASPFLFPCTIEYSLICAVILYEMWKKVKSLPDIERSRRNSDARHKAAKKAHHFSVDCARAHRGMFAGIIVIVLTIICLIMYFVLHEEPSYEQLAIAEVTACEIILYTVTALAVLAAVVKMRDLKFHQTQNASHASSVKLDCTLLVLAQTGVYLYGMFSIMASYFTMTEDGGTAGLVSEILSLVQTSVQTLFILNACWRRCRGAEQHRNKPGREIVTFLLVANMSMWFINTLIKGRAGFRPTHLDLYGEWAWTVITHVSMPLAIFYRFHSTICLFEIWKSAYKA